MRCKLSEWFRSVILPYTPNCVYRTLLLFCTSIVSKPTPVEQNGLTQSTVRPWSEGNRLPGGGGTIGGPWWATALLSEKNLRLWTCGLWRSHSKILASFRTASLVTSVRWKLEIVLIHTRKTRWGQSSQISRSATVLIYILYVFYELFAIWIFNFTLKTIFCMLRCNLYFCIRRWTNTFITCVYSADSNNNASGLLTLFVDSKIQCIYGLASSGVATKAEARTLIRPGYSAGIVEIQGKARKDRSTADSCKFQARSSVR